VYHDPIPLTTQADPEWVITPRKLFHSSSQESDELITSKATFYRM
jgi:hypothetical protein